MVYHYSNIRKQFRKHQCVTMINGKHQFFDQKHLTQYTPPAPKGRMGIREREGKCASAPPRQIHSSKPKPYTITKPILETLMGAIETHYTKPITTYGGEN